MTVVSRFIRWFLKLPPAETYDIITEKNLRVPMRDGVILLADHYTPRGGQGKLPTILIRGPYVRRSGFFSRIFAECGYQIITQDARGTGGSGGTFNPFHQECDDGLDTLKWIENQDWFSGDLITFGASYLGFVQWAIAAEAGPRLKAMAVQIAFSDLHDALYPGGAFALQTFMGWVSIMNDPSLLNAVIRLITRDRKFKNALNHLPLGSIDRAVTGHTVPYYQSWLQRSALDNPYWEPVSFNSQMSKVSASVHLLSGWHDFFLPMVVRDYAALREAGKQPYLTIGPWAHSDIALNGIAINEGLAFFDAYIKRDRNRLRDEPVRIWVNGANEWRNYPDFPPPGTRLHYWYLEPGGYLALEPPEKSAPDTYRYDPEDPTPSVGGPLGPGLGVKAGFTDNTSLEARPDVLTYSSLPLDRELEIIGPVTAELYVCSSLEHADFFVRLCDVNSFGKSINVCDGLLRLSPGKPIADIDGCCKVKIDLWPTAYRFKAKHRIRVHVSSGAFPRYARNLGTAEPLATATMMKIARQSIFHDPDHLSVVILPLARHST